MAKGMKRKRNGPVLTVETPPEAPACQIRASFARMGDHDGGLRFRVRVGPGKSGRKSRKHRVDFVRAAAVFQDPLSLTIRDEDHREQETRWITLGKDASGRYVLVVSHIRTGESERRADSNDLGPAADAWRDSGIRGTVMKPEYDFSKAERGKFFKPDAEVRIPVYLDADIQKYLAELAASKGVPLDDIVSGLLKQEIQIIESVK